MLSVDSGFVLQEEFHGHEITLPWCLTWSNSGFIYHLFIVIILVSYLSWSWSTSTKPIFLKLKWDRMSLSLKPSLVASWRSENKTKLFNMPHSTLQAMVGAYFCSSSCNNFCHMLVQSQELVVPGDGIKLSSKVIFCAYAHTCCETCHPPHCRSFPAAWEKTRSISWSHLVTTKLNFKLHYQLGPEKLIKLSRNEC